MKSLKDLKGYVVLLEAEGEAPQPPAPAEEPALTKAPSDDFSALKKGDVSPDKVIDKLNTIRAGRSFKDPNIKTALTDYIGTLKKPERTALFAFLKGISQIMSGEVAGESAVEPADPAPSIEMKKVKLKRTVKPTIVKAGGKKEAGQEDTSAPVNLPTPVKPK